VLNGEVCAADIDGVCLIPELGGHLPDGVVVRLICDASVCAKDVDWAVLLLYSLGDGG
jgi:hypothetical protein